MTEYTNIELLLISKGKFSSKAAQFATDEGESPFWLPYSQIEFDTNAKDGEFVDVEMPEWLARQEGLE